MVRLREQELFCSECGKVKRLPQCCGKPMEADTNGTFFCASCSREIPHAPLCCNQVMKLRFRVRNIKKEIFENHIV
jgi:hypothetical protein